MTGKIMNKRQMIIGMHLGNGYGALPGAWRMPGVDPTSYTDYDARVRQAQVAERGKFHFLFLPDGPSAVAADVQFEPPGFNLDVMMTLAAVARATKRIGLVATGSTTFNEPFNLARQFKALAGVDQRQDQTNGVSPEREVGP
jgi:alkanesulfonate monooxygenase SsuD/methylene tetrahydromethanopterin reductase-like flavin-dependent oxidoreductase (luciferase family)